MKVVITGATKGLGRAIAEKFAKEGFDLAVCSRSSADLKQLKKDLLDINVDISVLTKVTDMSKKSQVLAFAKFISSKWNSIDVLMNNAGVFLPGLIIEEAEGQLEKMMDTNLYSVYHLTRALVPLMIPQKKGHIFNMCSVASLKAYAHGGSYSISKYALLGFSKNLREELKSMGIKVTSIMPGATWSASWEGVEQPEDRLMQASDIADTVWSAYSLSNSAVVEDIVLRPQLGDL